MLSKGGREYEAAGRVEEGLAREACMGFSLVCYKRKMIRVDLDLANATKPSQLRVSKSLA